MILLCIYGIIGIPDVQSIELMRNWNNNIRLGLDLKGGSHLVLQVQVQDAFKAEAASGRGPSTDELTKAEHRVDRIDNTEPQSIDDADKVEVNIKGVPPRRRQGVPRHLAAERFPNWCSHRQPHRLHA